MTSKERVLAAIEQKKTDRVPVFSTFTPEIDRALKERFPECAGDIGIYIGNDAIKVSGGMECSFHYKDTEYYTCPFGITWKNQKIKNGYLSEPYVHPLQNTPERIFDYTFPDPDAAVDVYRKVEDMVTNYGDEYWTIGSCRMTIFESAWYLRGLAEFLMDMICEEEYVGEFLDRTMAYSLKMCLNYIDLGVDMVWVGDDVATQRGMMMSPELWRQYLKPRYKVFFDTLKKKNPKIKIAYHSCGNCELILDEMAEIGLDMIHPIQPKAMDVAHIKETYGKKLALFGAVDQQSILPFGTKEDVKNECKKLIEICGRDGGFLMAPAHHIQSDTSVENVLAIYEAVREMEGK